MSKNKTQNGVQNVLDDLAKGFSDDEDLFNNEKAVKRHMKLYFNLKKFSTQIYDIKHPDVTEVVDIDPKKCMHKNANISFNFN